ncbi:MAG TPA: hypothetical protein VH352_11160, partial [Pseudonocardiaceae bacterium]|nr:hypothetical protein [Pseudonocardiaceae bacterium]
MSSNRPPDTRRPWSPKGWSLRTRLLAGIVVLLAVVCLVIGVVSELFLHGFLVGQLNSQLSSAVRIASTPPPRPPGAPDQPFGQQPPPPANAPPPCASAPATFMPRQFPGVPTGSISMLVVGDRVMGALLTTANCQVPLTEAQTAAAEAGSLLHTPYAKQIQSLGDYELMAATDPRG